ncbi:MAG TPA: hypothetical protein PKA33_16020 [Amaricoccus sp.]|uniref:hypothetical protein n=1 Tax=Amaricoccus sp. TaxID=1872485 RepID=UPI002BC44880|nr:hypothetical protein [Amaricoccus sp.]HMQ92491.1 hypothetical protein [Amaricoccus sp.]HMR53860.1 hypothetical protein [Amaricoccus sp.]HMR58977.1 hypothetical protein [Amaricoccus sp.]HMU00855.1 hypothetical protein [Amaricoccus sp.]
MNRINQIALENATVAGYGFVDDFNDLHLYDGAIHDRHSRSAAVVVIGDDVASAALTAVETYNTSLRRRRTVAA